VSTNSVNTHPLAKWSGNATPKRNKPIKKKEKKKNWKENELRAGTDGVMASPESSLVRENIFSLHSIRLSSIEKKTTNTRKEEKDCDASLAVRNQDAVLIIITNPGRNKFLIITITRRNKQKLDFYSRISRPRKKKMNK
jgi:hypothetical protein